MKVPNIAKLASQVALGQVVGVILFAAFTVLCARSMSVSSFGTFAALYAASLVLSDVFDFGTGAKVILASANYGIEDLNTELGILRASRTIAAGLFVVLVAPLLLVFAPDTVPQFLAMAAVVWTFSLRVIRQVQQRCMGQYLRSSATLILERGATLAASAVVVPSSPSLALLCIVIGTVFALAVSGGEFGWRWSGRAVLERHRLAASLGVSSVATDVTTMDVPLLRLIVDPVVAGIYAVPARLLSPLSFLGSAFSTVLLRELPHLSREAAMRSTWRWVAFVCATAGLICGPVLLFAPLLVETVLGPDYRAASTPVRIACVTAVAQCGVAVAAAGLQALDDAKSVAKVAVTAALAGLIGVGIGGVIWGASGASIAMMSVQLGQFGTMLVGLNRHGRDPGSI